MASGSADSSQSVVTMQDVLDEEHELQLETAAVLGGSDERNCAYIQDYMKRQALYSCLTCLPESKEDFRKGAGICLACSYSCHEGHELIELYTKRNFRCDCGTPKTRRKCLLDEKSADNAKNEYNQNYSGLYCTCHRPYPDPEDSPEDADEMIQCIVCEDWYHSKHLDTEVTPAADFAEMICGACVQRVDFLKDYTGLCVTTFMKSEADDSTAKELNVTATEEEEEKEGEVNATGEATGEATDKKSEATEIENEIEDSPSQAKKAKLEEIPASSSSTTASTCTRPTNPGQYVKGALFWSADWRQQLCVCEKCLGMYRQLKVEYLIDLEDTVKFYEDKGMAKQAAHESDYERGMRELSGLDRVRQIDAITAYNKMKTQLKDYLNQFVDSQQVVTEADIKRFFEQMRNDDQKDLLVHSDIPFNCR